MKKSILILLLFIFPFNLSTVFADNSYFEELFLYKSPNKDIEIGPAISKPENLLKSFDNNFTTSWKLNTNNFIFLTIPDNYNHLNIFSKDNPIKTIKLSFFIGFNPEGFTTENGNLYKILKLKKEDTITLKKNFSIQSIKLPIKKIKSYILKKNITDIFKKTFKHKIQKKNIIIKLQIEDTYKNLKNNISISELFFSYSYIHNKKQEQYKEITKIYTNKDENILYIDTANKKKIILLQDKNSIYQISEISPKKQWITIIRIPSHVDQGRVETEYLILNTYLGKIMNTNIEKQIAKSISGPLFLIEKKNSIFLECSTKEKFTTTLIKLN